MLETFVNRESWKATRRLLADKGAEEKLNLLEEFEQQRQISKIEQLQTPVIQKKKRPALSPPDRPEKNVLRQPDGTFTVVIVKGRRQRTENGGKQAAKQLTQWALEVIEQKEPEKKPFQRVDR